MTINTDIKFYVNTNTSSPQLTNNFGCMLNVLDACLVNGFGSQTISSLTYSNNIATATFASAHNFMQYQVIKIVGATQAEYNIETRILTVPNSTTITFKLNTAPSVTTATGTISCSLPPLNWEKPFSSTHTSGIGGKGAYRSKNILLSSRPFLRVVDEIDPAYTSTYAKYAKVGIVEDMSDIDTMIGVQAPYDSANPNKNWVGTGSGASVVNGWAKWYYATNSNGYFAEISTPTAGNSPWIIIGTTDYFYLINGVIQSDTSFVVYGFGSFKSLINNDTSNTFLSASLSNITANSSGYRSSSTSLSDATSSNLLLLRSYTQTAQSFIAKVCSFSNTSSYITSGGSNYVGAYNLTNISPIFPVFINEPVLRGEMYSIHWLFQLRPYNNFQLIEKNNEVYIALNTSGAGNQNGQVVLKVGEI